MPTTLIVPGVHGSAAPHWQHWWTEVDAEAVLVEQDDWDRPDLAAWMLRLGMTLAEHPGAWIVAHSLGAILTTHVAARWPQLAIGGALLVAPADVEAGRLVRLNHFGPISTARLPFPAAVVASRDDPFVAHGRAEAMAADWGAAFVDYGFAGHINVASGFGPWPQGMDLLRRMQGARAPLASLSDCGAIRAVL